MTTLKSYFDNDFDHVARLYVTPSALGLDLEMAFMYDFAANSIFFMCYIPDTSDTFDICVALSEQMMTGKSQFNFARRLTLPNARKFHGDVKIYNTVNLEIKALFYGESEPVSSLRMDSSRRIFIYAEHPLEEQQMSDLRGKFDATGHLLQIRSRKFAEARSAYEAPLAFISYDSRDKEPIANKIAFNLSKNACPVWYDQFSLQVGDNLRSKIEDGLRVCKKCIVILTENFISNKGWTRKEFDSVFIREIQESLDGLILPVWSGVNSKEAFKYCPSLANVMGLDWDLLGEAEVCRRLTAVILRDREKPAPPQIMYF